MLPTNKQVKVALIAVFIIASVVLGSSQMYSSDFPVDSASIGNEIGEPTDSLITEELTIVSFNIRDVKGTKRTLEDFQEIARMIGGADIVVFQELGAKGFKKSGKNKAMLDRFDAMAAVYVAYLGNEWEFVFAPEATPIEMGIGAELPCVAYRKNRGKLSINVDWKEYYDLGDRRDMGMFNVICKQGSIEERFVIGSVHTKPDAPERIEEINRIADYIDENVDSKFILMGDMNWGYQTSKKKFPDRYNAEERIVQQHADGKVLQVFNSISYTGPGSDDDFRTNLDIRKVGQMYDQFLVCKAYSSKMAHGNKLDEDCGFYSFSEEDYFQDAVDDEVNNLIKGYKVYLKRQGLKMSSKEAKAKIKEMEEYVITNAPPNEGPTHRLSDHKPIWMQLKLF